MVKTIYVGNLPYSATEEALQQLFEEYGPVFSVKLVTDRVVGRPRGFGFVNMGGESARQAISHLNGFEFGGRPLRVHEAHDRRGRRPARRPRA